MNNAFLRKLAEDELKDTLFFATGIVPSREKFTDYNSLSAGKFECKIYSNRKIVIGKTILKSVYDAKLEIQKMVYFS